MTTLYVKQKVFAIGGRFAVTDADQQPRYQVSGSFLRIPKTFTVTDTAGTTVATITKTVLSLLPRFTVAVGDRTVATIRKRFTFFRARYAIDSPDLSVDGDWWDLRFTVRSGDREVARVREKLVSWGDTYEVEISEESLEVVVVALVVAIDTVKADQAASSSAST